MVAHGPGQPTRPVRAVAGVLHRRRDSSPFVPGFRSNDPTAGTRRNRDASDRQRDRMFGITPRLHECLDGVTVTHSSGAQRSTPVNAVDGASTVGHAVNGPVAVDMTPTPSSLTAATLNVYFAPGRRPLTFPLRTLARYTRGFCATLPRYGTTS